MNIQEISNTSVSDIEIKTEKFEESSPVNKPSTQIISKESPSEEKFSLKDCSFVKHETVVFKTEEDDTFCELTESNFIEREIKDEYFDESESIDHEDVVIKPEYQEDDQSICEYFDPEYDESRKTFTCTYCYSELTSEKYKTAHERRCKFRKKRQHVRGSVFECSFCKLLYTREEDKNKHQTKCKKRKRSEKYVETFSKKDRGRYSCDNCNYEKNRKDIVTSHSRTHNRTNATKHSCRRCPFQTIHNSCLRRHRRTHHTYGLACIFCQISFNEKKNLDAHYLSRHPDRSDIWVNIITNKINECPNCEYRTIYKTDFKDHLATHETPANQIVLECNICGYKSIHKGRFTSHMRCHSGQLPYVCTKCDKKFNRKTQLDGHILTQHLDSEQLMRSVTSKVHQCGKCDYKTVWNDHLTRHYKSYHGR